MATSARSAPVPERSALVEDPHMQKIVQRSRSLIDKILLAIPDTHNSCIVTEALKLDSSDNTKLAIMATTIGITPAPVLKLVSENFTLETCLKRMVEGLQLHRALLAAVSPRLDNKDGVSELQADIRDLAIQINKMLMLVQEEAAVQPTQNPVTLNLQGDYEVQVAVHLTLVQLQSFGQDMLRCLRSLDQNSEEEETKR